MISLPLAPEFYASSSHAPHWCYWRKCTTVHLSSEKAGLSADSSLPRDSVTWDCPCLFLKFPVYGWDQLRDGRWTSVGRVLACSVHEPLGFHPQHLKLMLVYAHNPNTQMLEEGILVVQGHLFWDQTPPLSFTHRRIIRSEWTVVTVAKVVTCNSILFFKICFISCVWVFAWMHIHQVCSLKRGPGFLVWASMCRPSRALSTFVCWAVNRTPHNKFTSLFQNGSKWIWKCQRTDFTFF